MNLIWWCILGLGIVIFYLWYKIFRLQIVLGSIIIKENAINKFKEIMKDIELDGGRDTERN